jgi:hypothetical protein
MILFQLDWLSGDWGLVFGDWGLVLLTLGGSDSASAGSGPQESIRAKVRKWKGVKVRK